MMARDMSAALLRAHTPSCRTVTRHDLVSPLPHDLQPLFEQAARQNLEATWHWYANLHRTLYSADPAMTLWVLRDGSRAIAALPVRVGTQRWVRTLWPLGHGFYTALFTPAVADDASLEDLAELLRSMVQFYRPLHSLRLAPMDPDAPAFKLLEQALQDIGMPNFRFFCFANWSLKAPETWPQYLAGRSANQRSAIRRGSRKLGEHGGRVEIVTHPGDVVRGMAAYWRVYAASWKQDEPWPGFVDGLASSSADRGELRLGLAWLGDEPIAVQLWLVGHGRAEIVKLAYDETHKALAPGNALTATLLQHVIEHDRVRHVDYLIGGDAYKRIWMSHQVERWGLVAYNRRSAIGLAGWLLQALAERARRWRNAASITETRPAASAEKAGADAP